MAGIRCTSCSGPLIEITLSIDDDQVTMRSCSACDRRSWYRGDEQMDLSGLIAAGLIGAPGAGRRR